MGHAHDLPFALERFVARAPASKRAHGLDDAEKPVPVLDASAHRVRIARAPRVYRFPARLSVVIAGVTTSERGFLVVHKRGLERFE